MKKNLYTLQLLMCFMVVLLSCGKKNDVKKKVEIDPNNLTSCRINNTCEFLFTEQADIDNTNRFKSGIYRLFWSRENFSGGTNTIYVKAPMQGTSFELGKEDILAGKVVYAQVCPACSMIGVKMVDGYVKGINVTPEKPADKTKWLLEGKIMLQSIGNDNFKDTLYVKQYFTPNFIFD